MSGKSKYFIFILCLVSAYAVGRWAAPEKVVVKTEVVEVEKKSSSSDSDKEKKKDTETHVIEYPDGRKETIITTHEEWQKHLHDEASSDSLKSSKDEKVVTGSSGKVTVSALIGVSLGSLTSSPPLWGASVSKPILGPIAVGFWGLTNHTFGASLGLTF